MGEEFNIESEIVERYDMTLVELMAELYGIEDAEKAEYIATIKKNFEDAAQMIETTSIDKVLSLMFLDAEEGFIETVSAAIDRLDGAVSAQVTVDANGNILSMECAVPDIGFEYAVTFDGNTATLVIKENGEEIATGSVEVTEEYVGGDTIVTLVMDLCDDENDLLDCTIVAVNGTITQANVEIRGYVSRSEASHSPSTPPTYTQEFVTLVTIEYEDLGADGVELTVITDTTVDTTVVTITATEDRISMVTTQNDEIMATIELISYDTGITLSITDGENTMLEFNLELTEDMTAIRSAWLIINTYYYMGEEEPELVEVFNGRYEWVDNETGMDFITVGYGEMEFILGYELTDDGINAILTDSEGNVYGSFEVVTNGQTTTVDVFAEMLLDMDLTITSAEGEWIVDIDLEHLMTSMDSYVEFDGGIKLKVA